jgi:hypothetical protein
MRLESIPMPIAWDDVIQYARAAEGQIGKAGYFRLLVQRDLIRKGLLHPDGTIRPREEWHSALAAAS